MTDVEKLLDAWIFDKDLSNFVPQSRIEEYLLACINKTGSEGLPTPQTRVEALLKIIAEDVEDDVEVSGTLDIVSNGIYNVVRYRNVNVQIPDVVVKTSGGTPVPNTGYVEKIYFNTNLSVEEVVSLLNNANLTLVNEGYYYVLFNSDGSLGVGIETNGIDYGIFIGEEYIFNSQISKWLEFENPFLFNQEVASEGPGFTIGNQNEALSSLISTTPFGSGDGKVLSGEYDGSTISITENGTIDINSMLDEQKLPLKINVNVAGSGSGSSGEAIEVSTPEEMDALLVAENIGLVYKYTGVTNENYTYGKLYTIEEV